MRVLINGLPYFAARMEKDLNEFDPRNRYVFCNTYESFWGKIKYFFLVPFAGALISVNGVTENSRSLNWLLKWRKKLILYWQGTDVSIAIEGQKNGTIDRRYIEYAAHFGVAPWFVEELKEVNVACTYVPFAYMEQIGNDGKYEEFKILTYLATGAEEFYGWTYLLELAKARPDLKITVVGSDGANLEHVENVNFLGWVSAQTMVELYRSHAVFVRLTAHDGKSFSVAQALSAGSEVIWTYSYPPSHQVPRDTQALLAKIQVLETMVKARDFAPNQDIIEHSRRSYDRKIILTRLVDELQRVLNG